LSNNGLGIKGGKSIADALRLNKTLTYVSLHTNNLSDKLEEQLRHVSSIKRIIVTLSQLGDEKSLDGIIKNIEVKASNFDKKTQVVPLRILDSPVKPLDNVVQHIHNVPIDSKPVISHEDTVAMILRNGNQHVRPEEAVAAQGLEELLNEDFLQKKRKLQ
jgi:hypothetical protein